MSKTKRKGKAIGNRNRLALAYMELTRDKVFNKLSEEDKLKLVKEVIALGNLLKMLIQ